MNRKSLIVLPGYDGCGEKTFRKLAPLLGKKYQVRMINYPYFDNPDKQYSLDELVDFVDKNIDGKTAILGFSMGGFVASRYAQKHPGKVEKLILVSTATTMVLDEKLKLLLNIADIFLRSKLIASTITNWFLKSNLKNFPLPKPGRNFKVEQGYAVFGSLTKVLKGLKSEKIKTKKEAILFEDDGSFPAKIYGPLLKKQGFRVRVHNTGGHAQSEDYWEKVARSIQG